MKLSEKQQIFTLNVAKLINYAYDNGFKLTFGEVERRMEMQKLYFANGKTRTMNSQHLKRLAVDFNFFINGRLTYDFDDVKLLGEYWESLHQANRWGGDWNNNGIADGFIDTPHFEMLD